jgi:D-alanyl-lipoteichoic acid acyltransferase DltB (MBOAT superfamily)
VSLISQEFAAFVAITALLFHLSPPVARPPLLVAASVLFCALNNIASAVALIIATMIAFYAGRWSEAAVDERRRRILLLGAAGLILAHLVLIKLMPHLGLPEWRGWLPELLGTFGASYYTLKLTGYLIDLYWRRYPAWTNPVKFGAFATLYPLLPAGPIQRANEFAPAEDDARIAELVTYGLRRILLGLLKKLLVADRLGALVDYIGGGQADHSNVLWVMAYLFPVQLYVDFSALTDIGIGVAAIFGIRGPENFAFPFFASSISEFWRRWHMSLTRWLGDYVFTPLRMATRSFGNAGLAVSIVVNMTLIGMWHAVSFGWLLFGLINAAFLITDALTGRFRRRMYKRRPGASRFAALAGPVIVFHMIAFSLVCFRAQTLPDIGYFFGNLFIGLNAPIAGLKQLFYSYGRGRCAYDFAALCGFVLLESGLYLRSRRWTPLVTIPRFVELPRAVRWVVYYLSLLAVGVASQQSSRFIYVQF